MPSRAARACCLLACCLSAAAASADCPASALAPQAGQLDDAEPLIQMQVSQRLSSRPDTPTDNCEDNFENYRFWCDPNDPDKNIAFADGNCAFVTRTTESCNQFCHENGNRTCYAAAGSEGGCDWKPNDPSAGTAEFCNKVLIRQVCVCSEETSSTTVAPDPCIVEFGGSGAGFKGVCDQEIFPFANGNCALLIQTGATDKTGQLLYEGSNCDGYCKSQGLECYAAARNQKGCSGFKEDEPGAGTDAYCKTVQDRQVCVCDQGLAATPAPTPAPTPSPTHAPTCDETLTGPKDSGYRGCQSHTRSGKECQAWTSQQPHKHGYTPDKYPTYGLGSHNFCRNPSEKTTGKTIWCYTTDSNKRWEYCDPLVEPPSGGDWCGKSWKDSEFSKCDYWGDPHFKKTFSEKKYDIMGLGAFLLAGTKSDDFEVQNFQCEWGNNAKNALAVGIAIRFGSDTVVISQDKVPKNRVWINGKDATDDFETVLPGLGLKISGDLASTSKSGGLQIMSSDCRYRFMSLKKVHNVHPGFWFGGIVRVPSEDELEDGMCTGCEHQKNLSTADLLFSDDQIKMMCTHCLTRPDICEGVLPPTPATVVDACEEPPHPCKNAPPGCGFNIAEEACDALDKTDCFDGCVWDFCASGCNGTVDTDECIEEPPDTTTTTPGVTGDPHVTNVDGERFSLAREGVHELLRLPRRSRARDDEALLEVLGSVESEQKCTEPFVRQLDLDGRWLRTFGPLSLRAGGWRREGEGAAQVLVNGSRVHLDDLRHDARLRGLLEVAVPKAKHGKHSDKINRDKYLTMTLRFPAATLRVDWVHREVPGSVLNHLNLHVVDLPKILKGMDVGGILGRDDHALAASPSEDCAPNQYLISGPTSSLLSASYKRP